VDVAVIADEAICAAITAAKPDISKENARSSLVGQTTWTAWPTPLKTILTTRSQKTSERG